MEESLCEQIATNPIAPGTSSSALEQTQTETKRPKKKFGTFVKIFIALTVILGVSLILNDFFIHLVRSPTGGVEPFNNRSVFILSEKVSYLFRKPRVSEAVLFNPDEGSFDFDFIGIITDIDEEAETYKVMSAPDKPWKLTVDKIKRRIYLPKISDYELQQAQVPQSKTPLPTSQAETPTLIGKQQLYMLTPSDLEQITELTLEPSKSFGFINPAYDQIGRSIYFVNGQEVIKYSLDSKLSKSFYKLGNENKSISKIDFKTPNILITVSNSDYYANTELSIIALDIEGNTTKSIGPIVPVMYGNLEYLDTISDKDILTSFGGDGCGGYGEIYQYSSGKYNVLTKAGAGCVRDPRYIGYIKEKRSIILASAVDSDSYNYLLEGDRYDELYYLNLESNAKDVIYNLKQLKGIARIILSNTQDKILVITNASLITINLDTKQTEGSVSFKSPTTYLYDAMLDNLLYIHDPESGIIYQVDTANGTITKHNKSIKSYGSSQVFLGEYNDNPLLFVSIM